LTDKIKSNVWIFPVIWMLIIFVFSHQPGNESAELSGGITQILMNILQAANITLDILTLHDVIRTIAHFMIFFILGYLWYITFRTKGRSPRNSASIALIICVVYAFFDEAHQYFIPGRACELKDVMVDGLGAGCAIAIGWLLSTLRQKVSI